MRAIFFLSVVLMSFTARGRECDPEKILLMDSRTTIRNHEIALILAKRATSIAQDKELNSIEFSIPGLPSPVGLNTAKTAASLVESSTDINYSKKEYDFIIEKYLSDNSFGAWKECLESQELLVNAPKHAVSDSDFFITIDWRPSPLVGNNARLNIVPINGVIQRINDKVANAGVESIGRGQHRVQLSGRDTSRKTEILFEISNEHGKISETLFIPPYVTYVFSTIIQRSNPVSVRGRSNGTRAIERCITRTTGYLLPDADWIVETRTSGTKKYVDIDNGTHEKVCGGLKATGEQAKIQAVLTVTELFVEVQEGSGK